MRGADVRREVAVIAIVIAVALAMGATNVLQVWQGGFGRGTVGAAGTVPIVNDAGTSFDYTTIVGWDGGVVGTVTSVSGAAPLAGTVTTTGSIGCATCLTSGWDAGGDVSGTFNALRVIGLQGVPVADAGVAVGGVLVYAADGGNWFPEIPLPVSSGGTGVTSISVVSSTTTPNVAITTGASFAALSHAKNTVLSTDGSNVMSFAALDVANNVTGILPVANGGTGLATLTAHSLQVGNGTTALTQLGLGTTTTLLHGNASGDPTWSAVSLTGDVTGTLGVGNGGTGIATAAAGSLIVGGGGTAAFAPLSLPFGMQALGQGATTAPAAVFYPVDFAFWHRGVYYPITLTATSFTSVFGGSGISALGTASSDPQSDDNYVRWTCSTTANASCGSQQSAAQVEARWNPRVSSRIRSDATWSATFRAWVALSDVAETTLLDGGAHNVAGVRYSTTASDTAFMCCDGDGTTTSCVTTGVSPNTGGSTAYDIVVEISGSTTYCTVNGTQVTHTANQPTASTSLLAISIGACANGASTCASSNLFRAAGLEVAWQ